MTCASTELVNETPTVDIYDFRMRTIVEIPDAQVRELDELAKKEARSRAALIREAVAALLAKRSAKKAFDDAFGLWGRLGADIDGLAYQRRLRREW